MAEIKFETALAELDKILRDLEDGNATLDESLAKYERGIGLLRNCRMQLDKAEQKIQELSGTDANGNPVLQKFEHTSTMVKTKKVNEPPF